MGYFIATYRPFGIKSISWVNSITRNKQRAPFDHVCYLENGYIYESVVKKGVRRIPFDEWVNGRDGTHLFMYEVKNGFFDLNEFDKIENTDYDVPANFWHLLNIRRLLFFNPNKEFTCGEFLAKIAKFENTPLFTPRMWVDLMDSQNRILTHQII